MPKSGKEDRIPGFRCIGPEAWEQAPIIHWDWPWEKHQDAPDVILLFTWTGAQSRHIQKYAESYRSLFPSSTIMVVRTSIKDFWFRNSQSRQARLRPAIERMLSYKKVDNVLVHAYSEGGSNKAWEFAEAYRNATGSRMPCTAMILNSAPGKPRFLRLCQASTKSLPSNPVCQYTGLAVSFVVVGCVWSMYRCIKGWENNMILKTRRKLLDGNIWDLSAHRCYFFSKSDELVWCQDVLEHARESIEAGVPVTHACFQASAHCRHAGDHPETYWDTVTATWNRASEASRFPRKEKTVSYPLKALLRVTEKQTGTDSESERTVWSMT